MYLDLFSLVAIGKYANLRCKPEAGMPSLLEFIKEHQYFGKELQKVIVITDDKNIMREISSYSHLINFVRPEPAPTRIADKVKCLSEIYLCCLKFLCCS